MTGRSVTGTQRAYRALLFAYPRSLRREHGQEMVQLVGDRQSIDGEPLWRLWPSLLNDTAKGAVVTRWEHLMSTNRAIVLGLIATIAVLAALSDGPRTAVPIIVALTIAARLVVRSRTPQPVPLPARSGRRWLVAGAVLLITATVQLVVTGDDELPEWQWPIVFCSLLGGILAAVVGTIVLVSDRRSAVAG